MRSGGSRRKPISAGWVAGSVRARAPARSRMDSGVARRVAACGSLADALQLLAATPYGANIRCDQTLAAAQHEVPALCCGTCGCWQAGCPGTACGCCGPSQAGSRWRTSTSCSSRLRAVRPERVRLGALATAWPRLAQAASAGELRTALAASAWRDPAIRRRERYAWACAHAGRRGSPSWVARPGPGPRTRTRTGARQAGGLGAGARPLGARRDRLGQAYGARRRR